MPSGAQLDRPVLRSIWARSDWGLMIAALGLSLIGALLVWSATRSGQGTAYLVRHLVNTGIGVALALTVTRVRHDTLRLVTPVLYLASVIGLVAVLSPLGSTVNGSRSWIRLPGGFSVQPSEFAKVALCLGLAMVLADAWSRGERPGLRHIGVSVVALVVPIGLVLAQPDLGSALVLVALGFGTVAVGGVALRWVIAAAALGAAAVVAAMTTSVLSPYQRNRLTAFIDPAADPQGFGYQARQVRLAITSGGWQGAGLFEGPQTQGGFIPFQETDFIFSVAAEELGFIGAGGVIVLLGFLVVRTLVVGLRAPDAFGRIAATGVAVWFGAQAFENIGMNLGLMPVTGLPLPFLSYGGSSMFACWLAVGVVNNVHLVRPGHE